MPSELFKKAFRVAQDYDVSTPENSIVLYSVSFLPTKENRENAFNYVKSHPERMMIEHTDCGAKLVEMGLLSSDCGLSNDEISDIWSIASKRFIEAAKGDVVAFVKGADPRSVFRTQELPSILNNEHISTINGENKFNFAKKFSK
ncbi:MAG: hypothetical protein Q4F75_05905 [Pseudomonadota bacterium]|nr:hypothetical protein [Pseudomonadota bacterium]